VLVRLTNRISRRGDNVRANFGNQVPYCSTEMEILASDRVLAEISPQDGTLLRRLGIAKYKDVEKSDSARPDKVVVQLADPGKYSQSEEKGSVRNISRGPVPQNIKSLPNYYTVFIPSELLGIRPKLPVYIAPGQQRKISLEFRCTSGKSL
jgi:hypothetical protein